MLFSKKKSEKESKEEDSVLEQSYFYNMEPN